MDVEDELSGVQQQEGFEIVVDKVKRQVKKVPKWKAPGPCWMTEARTVLIMKDVKKLTPFNKYFPYFLDEFTEWTNTNKLSLNPSNCQAIQTCFKTKPPPHAELNIAGVPLNFVSEEKVLGVWLQNDLRWEKNIHGISKKANQKLYMLRLLKRFGFNDDKLISIYKNYVRPAVEYADVTWSSSITAAQKKTL